MKISIYPIHLLLLITTSNLHGQTISIDEAKKLFKKSGMSESQARSIAKSKGYSDKEIDSAIRANNEDKKKPIEASKIDSENSSSQKKEESSTALKDESIKQLSEENIVVNQINNSKSLLNKKQKNDSIDDKTLPNYFGYDIFKRSPDIFQPTSIGVVDPEYIIGPEDEIIVMLWGETQFRQVLTVNREGFIFIPEIGQVFVNGLNLRLLESKLYKVLSQSYASLNPASGKATTFLDVSLGKLRPLRIQVLGEISQPGAYSINPTATLFSSLYYFNGPTHLGSLRDVRLIREDNIVASIDFYDYLLTGKKPSDQKLQLDDVVFIPKRKKTVTVKGKVNRPAIYELKDDETLFDLIEISGGLEAAAYIKRAKVERIVPYSERDQLGYERVYMDVDLTRILDKSDEFELSDEDIITVSPIFEEYLNVVEIHGSVMRPGEYDIEGDMRLFDLIMKADSLYGDAFLDRVDITRTNEDFTQKIIIKNLKKCLQNDPEHNLELQALDKVHVYSKLEMIKIKYVEISGHVRKPGQYELLEDMSLYDLIFKSGGFIDKEFKKKAFLDRAEIIRVNENDISKEVIPFNLGKVLLNDENSKIKLQPNDHVHIYSKEDVEGAYNTVTIKGRVKNPGDYELYQDNMTAYDLIFKAGGLFDEEWKEKTYLERADLLRFENDRINRKIKSFNLKKLIESRNSKENFLLFPGDIIKVYDNSTFNSVKVVTIKGAIKNPGEYNFKLKMKLNDLIIESGGISENVYKYNVEIARINPNNKDKKIYADIIKIDLLNDLKIDQETSLDHSSLNEKGELELHPYDIIHVRPDPYFEEQRIVEVLGAVWFPGSYVITSADEMVTDIIKRAGGLRQEAYPNGSSFVRNGNRIQISYQNLLEKPNSKFNFKVKNGDQIIIAESPELVFIKGEVNNQGAYKYIKGKRLGFYLKNAGGLSKNADEKNIYVTFPNGQSLSGKGGIILTHKIIDGTTIHVPKKEEQEPFDVTDFVKEIASIMADLAQIVVLLIVAQQ